MSPTSASAREYGPWLTAESAAEYLDFRGVDPVNAFRKFARRQGIACAYRGDRPLYRRSDLDKAIGAAHRGAR
jgi:hypothetical protein